jgi:hypothetical protein
VPEHVEDREVQPKEIQPLDRRIYLVERLAVDFGLLLYVLLPALRLFLVQAQQFSDGRKPAGLFSSGSPVSPGGWVFSRKPDMKRVSDFGPLNRNSFRISFNSLTAIEKHHNLNHRYILFLLLTILYLSLAFVKSF